MPAPGETRLLIATGEAAAYSSRCESTDHDAWQERGLIDGLRSAFYIPMTVFEIDEAGRVPPAEPQA